MPNGVAPTVSYTTAQAAAQITRANQHWATVPNQTTEITYAFRAAIPDGYTGTTHKEGSSFQALTLDQQLAFAGYLQLWEDVANVHFRRVTEPGSTLSNTAAVLVGTYDSSTDASAAFALPPGDTAPGSLAGDVWLNRNYFGPGGVPALGARGGMAIIHEIGHALGLQHPGDYNAAPGVVITYENDALYIEDTNKYTLMSYFERQDQPEAPLLHDIAAVQRLYGANLGTRIDNTVYGFNCNLTGANASIYNFAINAAPNFAIWDAGGIDTLNVSGFAANQKLDLRPDHFSSVGGQTDNIAMSAAVTDALGRVVNLIENAVGGAFSDTLIGNDAGNWLYGGPGSDSLDGGAGDDTASYAYAPDFVFADLLFSGGNEGEAYGDRYVSIEALEGSIFDDHLGGDTLPNRISGDRGADLIAGREGDDTLLGDKGDDTLIGEAGADSLDGGEGVDLASYAAASDAVIVDLLFPDQFSGGEAAGDRFAGVENLLGSGFADALGGDDQANTLRGGAGNDVLAGRGGQDVLYGEDNDDTLHGDQEQDILSGGRQNDELHGGTGDDVLQGDDGNDVLYGEADVDNLYGGKGEDILDGGSGADLLVGGPGNDRYYVDSNGDRVREATSGIYRGDGYDIVYAGTSFTLSRTQADIEVLRTTDDAGTGAINLTGNAYATAFIGNAGDNVIDGGAGPDTMSGLGGNDVYVVDDAGDVVIESDLPGADLVKSAVSFALGAQAIENLTLTGAVALSGTGNGLDNRITGNDAANLLAGGEGRDTLYGQGGLDTLQGGSGNDLIRGGNEANDTVAPQGDLIEGGDGTDRLYGEDGADTIWGGDGRDSLYGGNGNDMLYIDNQDAVVDGGAGTDYANAIAATALTGFLFTAVAGRGIEVIQGHDGHDRIDAAALPAGQNISIIGHGGNDTLRGGAGDDALDGFDGNDSIDGGAGFDQMHGFAGNDTIIGGGGGPVAPRGDWLFGGTGDDSLTGSGRGWVIGEDGNDTLVAGGGDDLLNGGLGQDSITGAAGFQWIIGDGGDDRLSGGADFDLFEFDDGWGNDVITDYQPGLDRLRFADVTGLDVFGQLLVTDDPGGARVGFAGSSVLLVGILASQVVATDMQF